MRKFCFRFLFVLIPIYLISLLYILWVVPNFSGDLGNLGQIPFGHDYKTKLSKEYPKILKVDNYPITNNNTYNIVTIGDSFSQHAIFGYQNYLAILLNENILNIPRNTIDVSPEQYATNLLKSGVFDKIQPKIVIIQSIERHFIFRLRDINFEQKVNNKQVLEQINTKKKSIPFLESITSWIRLSFGYQNPVVKVPLTTNFFTVGRNGNLLYFYKDDLVFRKITKDNISQAKSNLFKLKELFNAKGIKLLYIVAADKYDMYQSYIIDNKYPKNMTLEYFKNFESENFYLNTKKVLFPMVKNNIQDVYFYNDSHWTYKGSKAVGKEIYLKINSK